ncbi:Ran GTPase-activating protein 1 [Eumeta japonica]|uniref:Ran GTPase-activating protein 1 n=1 Tax=Eumeta variegata TaxID=151549 RepID=A0A4C1W5P4_EUMVA|nr:Ran GTPase-activating protein 1 [Eumeta japonica]
MARAFDMKSINAALGESELNNGVDFSGKSLKLDNEKDAQVIVDAIQACKNLHYLTLTGNTLGVEAAKAIAKALETHEEFKLAKWSDMFTGRMKTEIPPALTALGNGMITARARLSVLDLSDNAFGPIGVEGLAKLLQSEVCRELQELRLNNNGLGITGGRLLASALLSVDQTGNPPRLKVFVAGRNRLENDGAKALAEVFQKMGTLEEITMPQNGIYHPGITALSEAFKQNPNLTTLNLNDNTVGAKGAEAIARALPKLRNLKHVNFGDCLLKSRGAKTLAQGFKDHSVLLETLDLSHNEIGREACLEVVDCITVMPDSRERLTRVVLAGNSLGGVDNKQSMRDKLGDSAALSDGEASDEEYVTGSEEETDSEGSDGEDSAPEDAQHFEENHNDTIVHTTDNDITVELDTSGVEEVTTDVAKFLREPTLDNLKALGSEADQVIDAHLHVIKDTADMIQAYVEAVHKVSGLCDDKAPGEVRETARRLYARAAGRAGERHAAQWLLANAMLVGLGLIKSEDKKHKIGWALPGCYSVLSSVIDEPYFPTSLRETLRFFIQSKKEKLSEEVGIDLNKYPNLYQ